MDLYQPCPCGSGKKIKFCCPREIVPDLERVIRMIQGDQRQAALDKLQSLLAKHGNIPSLLMLKAEVCIEMSDREKGREILDQLRQIDPHNPSAWALESMLALHKGVDADSAAGAVDLLQNGLEHVGKGMPIRVYQAIHNVASALYSIGRIAAARAHLQLLMAVEGNEDDALYELVHRMSTDRRFHVLLRQNLLFQEAPDHVTWKREFDAAIRNARKGFWRLAAQQLESMRLRILDEPAILHNLAVLHTWLGNGQQAAQAWQLLAQLRQLPLEDRVEAQAMSLLLRRDSDLFRIPLVRVVFRIRDTDSLMERLASSPSCQIRDAREDRDEGPALRLSYNWLDRPALQQGQDVSVQDVPRLLGTLSVFGRQTDREPRLVLVTLKSHEYEPHLQSLRELAGDSIDPDPTGADELARLDQFSSDLFGGWQLPRNLTLDEVRQFEQQLREAAIYNRFPNTPYPWLDGKTPLDACADPKYKILLLAVILIVELNDVWFDEPLALNPLRHQLNLPLLEPIDPATVQLDRLPLARWARLEVEKLSDEDLLVCFERAENSMAIAALRVFGPEVLSRDTLAGQIDKAEVCNILRHVVTTTDEALEYLEKGRKLATAAGGSPAMWLVKELPLRLVRGETERFSRLVREIRERYWKEPGVADALATTLSKLGLVTENGQVRIPTPLPDTVATPDPTSGPARIWTPDRERAAVDTAAEHRPRIWVPGME